MREIKFRGKSLIPTVDLNYLNIEHNNGWVFGTYIDGYIVNDVIEANDEYITIGNWVPVDNVGQYTGLKDQKGVEIFEGDIVNHYWSNEVGESFCHKTVIKNPFDYKVNEAMHLIYADELEILGNIYQNNELLEV